jgi:hypothetical protein
MAALDLEDAFRARMLAVAGMADLIGGRWGGFGDRPQRGGMPAVGTLLVWPGEIWTHEGVNSLASPRVQIDVWAETADPVRAISRLIRTEMARTDRVTAGGWVFLPPAMCMIDERSKEPLAGGDPIFRNLFDYSLFAKPAV